MILENVLWRYGEKFGCQLVNFIISIEIARILEPSAYGIVAIVNTFIQIFTVFIDVGFGSYIVRNKNSDELDYSTAFTANVVLCLIIYTFIYLVSPLVSNFYDKDITSLLRVSSLTILISSVKNIQQAYVSRNIQFKKFFFSSLFGTICAGIIGVIMALKGFGVWALVFSNLTDTFIDTLIMLFTVEWKPRIRFSYNRFKEISKYSSRIIAIFLIDRIYNKLYHLSIGKFYTSEELAYYEKSKSFTDKIPESTDSIINSVIFPLMSNMAEDKHGLVNMARQYLEVSSYIMLPILMGLCVTANELIVVLLTDKWIQAVPYMRMLCLAEIVTPFITVNNNILKALGRSDIVLKNEIIKKVISILVLIFVMKKGVFYIIFSILILNIIYLIVDTSSTKLIIGYGIIEQVKNISKNILCTGVMAFIVYFISYIPVSIYVKLFIEIFLGIVSYLLMSIMFKNKSFYYLLNIIKEFVKKRKTR